VKIKHTKYLQLLGLVLFIYLLWKIDAYKALESIKNFSLIWFVLYAVCYLIMVLTKSYRWKTLLHDQNINYSFKKVLKINITSNFWGAITPGRLGEFIKLDFLVKDNVPIVKGILNIIIDRTFDVIMLFFFSFISFIYFGKIFYVETKGLILIFITLLIILSVAVFLRKGFKNFVKIFLKQLLPINRYKLVNDNWKLFIKEFKEIHYKTFIKMIFQSLLIYFLFFLMTFIVAIGFKVRISFIYLSLCVSISSLISLLPISVGGVGTREALFILLLGKISISKETALLIAFFDSTILGNFMAVIFILILKIFLQYKKRMSVNIES